MAITIGAAIKPKAPSHQSVVAFIVCLALPMSRISHTIGYTPVYIGCKWTLFFSSHPWTNQSEKRI